jgi:cysteine desulfurase
VRRVYFDHSGTTPVHPEVAEEICRYLTMDNFGNPSSIHHYGRQIRIKVAEARGKVARALGADPGEIVFTSGGTESDNMAIHGAAITNKNRGNHIITSAVEHHAVLNTVKALGKEGFDITILPVDQYGMVSVDDVAAAITDRTILITIMHANNEVGTIMPVAEIGKLARERKIIFHVDAVQSFGKIPVNVDDLGVSLLSLSGHKIYGPKGIGALYIRKGTRWRQTLFHGGAQERLRRAGTENIPGIMGLARAAELAMENRDAESSRLQDLRDRIIRELTGIEGVRLTGHPVSTFSASLIFITSKGAMVSGTIKELPLLALPAHLNEFQARSLCYPPCGQVFTLEENQPRCPRTSTQALFRAWSKSSSRSSMVSMPTDRRIKSPLTPVSSCSASVSCWWVVEAG